jgi:hypothetical protein
LNEVVGCDETLGREVGDGEGFKVGSGDGGSVGKLVGGGVAVGGKDGFGLIVGKVVGGGVGGFEKEGEGDGWKDGAGVRAEVGAPVAAAKKHFGGEASIAKSKVRPTSRSGGQTLLLCCRTLLRRETTTTLRWEEGSLKSNDLGGVCGGCGECFIDPATPSSTNDEQGLASKQQGQE